MKKKGGGWKKVAGVSAKADGSAGTPAISNKNLRHALSAYGKEHSLTYSILQEARSDAKAQLFGIAAENVKYAEGMKSELEKDGHIVKLMYTSRKATLRNVEQLVIGD